MPLQTAPESPVPVRTVLRLVGDWVGRLGRVWVEGQIAELTKRGNTVFLTLRDPVAAVSVRVICARIVLEAADPPPGEGARVVVWAKPDFNNARGSFSLAATEIRAVGIGELLARLERLRRSLGAEGLFAAERKRPLPFLPGRIGLICGRDSAAQCGSGSSRWPCRAPSRWRRSLTRCTGWTPTRPWTSSSSPEGAVRSRICCLSPTKP